MLALGVRCLWLGRPALLFLAWNLALAWAPLIFNGLAALLRLSARRWLGATAALVDFAWLMFLPNAPYLVTDLIHLTGQSLSGRASVPLWFDLLLFLSFAATGCWLGLVSLETMTARVSHRLGNAVAWLFAGCVCLLCGYGVFLGRFWRLNSWDLIERPTRLFRLAIEPLLDPIGHKGAVAFTATFAAFFGLQWALLHLATSKRPG